MLCQFHQEKVVAFEKQQKIIELLSLTFSCQKHLVQGVINHDLSKGDVFLAHLTPLIPSGNWG